MRQDEKKVFATMKASLLFTVLCILSPAQAQLFRDRFLLPFGGSVGDTQMHKNDDGGSSAFELEEPMIFFGDTVTKWYLNTNGEVTFDAVYRRYIPDTIPSTEIPAMAAIYWSDIDTTVRGDTFGRTTSDADELETISEFIETCEEGSGFSPDYAIVATWHRVGPYGGGLGRNSFQLIVAYSEGRTWAIFDYARLGWYAAATSDWAQRGFNNAAGIAGINLGIVQSNADMDELRTGTNCEGRGLYGYELTELPPETPSPTESPPVSPTMSPSTSGKPSAAPTGTKSETPTLQPQLGNTPLPTVAASMNPTSSLSYVPTLGPTGEPTAGPSGTPVIFKTDAPSDLPPSLIVTGFLLVATDTKSVIESLEDDDVISLTNGSQLSVEAVAEGSVGSVVLFLDGTEYMVENYYPYMLGGNYGEEYFPVEKFLPGGTFTVTAVPYSEPDGKGTAGTPLTVTFELVYEDDLDLMIYAFYMVDASVDEDVGLIEGGESFEHSVYGRKLSVRVVVSDDVDSVVFGLSGALTENANYNIENVPPYLLGGDTDRSGYHAVSELRTQGPFMVTATAYAGPDGTGASGSPATISFEIVD